MFSQTAEYALRAMMFLAAAGDDPSNRTRIAEATKAPEGYLSKVMRDLVRAGLVDSQRGPRGGFTLAEPPERISILRVVNAVDPIKRITRCPLGNPAHIRLCPLHQRLDNAIAEIEKSIGGTTLADLLETDRSRGECRTLTQIKVPRRKAAGTA